MVWGPGGGNISLPFQFSKIWRSFFTRKREGGEKLARPPTQQAIFNRVKKSMTEMGTYSKHYDDIIKIYAGLIFDYNAAREEFIENGSKVVDEYETNRGTIVERKTPIVQTMENLRKDIITYSDRLRLNPKAADIEVGKPNKEAPGLEGLIAKLI